MYVFVVMVSIVVYPSQGIISKYCKQKFGFSSNVDMSGWSNTGHKRYQLYQQWWMQARLCMLIQFANRNVRLLSKFKCDNGDNDNGDNDNRITLPLVFNEFCWNSKNFCKFQLELTNLICSNSGTHSFVAYSTSAIPSQSNYCVGSYKCPPGIDCTPSAGSFLCCP